MSVVVGGVIEKNGKYLLVQEVQKRCYGKWNLPLGRLEFNESITDGAKREIKEETGCGVEVTGICQLGNRLINDDVFLAVIFTTKLLKEDIKFDSSEILDVKWFSYEEIIAMKNDLRSTDLIINAINNSRNNVVAPLDIIQLIK